MSCGCAGNGTDAHDKQRVDELLGRAGLGEMFDQGRSAMESASTALTHLTRAERAAALGFGAEAEALHRATARRHNRRAVQQYDFLAQRIQAHRKQQSGWDELVQGAKAGFREHGGLQSVADAREEFRVHLYTMDRGLTADVSEQALRLFDRIAERFGDGDLDAGLDLLHEQAVIARDAFAQDDMGRAPASQALFHDDSSGPIIAGGQNVNGWCIALGVCLAWAISSLIASLIICFAVPFCWCCFHLVLMGSFLAHEATCLVLFDAPCRAQSAKGG